MHFTLHKPTGQPVDTLFALRLDAGRQTVVTLHFLREAFGYRQPVFPKELLDAFLFKKLAAAPQAAVREGERMKPGAARACARPFAARRSPCLFGPRLV